MSKKLELNIKLSELANGGAQEKFNHELKRIAENILDPNTDANKKRKIVLTTTFTPSDDRNLVTIGIDVKSMLAPENGVNTLMMVGRNDSGYIEANELKSGTPGQTYFDANDSTLKDDKGQPIDQIEQKSSNVVDLQAKNKA
ncbi:replication terminator protein [Loigolactobacillus coryniformis]|uniref:replication terminator protein n=1 Tax=Loigolactobacillus coryniformis TaxID=1610 RepID=UPI00201A26F8|nr:replication terminator protein [Loigolactobacillus coryniformis]MCL5458061.1 replication terminator protein [Loigolactobacillus coryniformis]